MDKIKEQLKQRLSKLNTIKKLIEQELEHLPPGQISAYRHNGLVEYHLLDPHNKTRYISKKKELPLIEKLSQKAYCQKALQKVDAEIKAIKRYFSGCPDGPVENTVADIDPELSKFVTPLVEDDESYKNNWLKEPYERLEMPESQKLTGREGFRSKSEWMIAKLLTEAGISYKYEKPLKIEGNVVYPDFTLLDVANRRELYWEHFGKIDDNDYLFSVIRKLDLYSRSGMIREGRLIVTMESGSEPVDIRQVRNGILSIKDQAA
jgi:hypothetical protein